MKQNKKYLSWGDIKDFYKKKTGQSALTQSMETIYKWVIQQPEIIINKDSSLSFKQEKNEKTH